MLFAVKGTGGNLTVSFIFTLINLLLITLFLHKSSHVNLQVKFNLIKFFPYRHLCTGMVSSFVNGMVTRLYQSSQHFAVSLRNPVVSLNYKLGFNKQNLAFGPIFLKLENRMLGSYTFYHNNSVDFETVAFGNFLPIVGVTLDWAREGSNYLSIRNNLKPKSMKHKLFNR